MGQTTVTFEIADAPPPRLDKALGRDVPAGASLSRSRLARLIVDGAVAVDGAVVTDPRFRVAAGAQIAVTVDVAEDSHIVGQDIPLDVIYEDDDLIVVNKPSGMVVHPAPGTPDGTLVNALIHHCGDSLSGVGGMKRPGVVHRIDKRRPDCWSLRNLTAPITGWPNNSPITRSNVAIWRSAMGCLTRATHGCAGSRGRRLNQVIS